MTDRTENGQGRPEILKTPTERIADIAQLINFGKGPELSDARDKERLRAGEIFEREGIGPAFAETQERESLLIARQLELRASEQTQDGGGGEEVAKNLRGGSEKMIEQAKLWGKVIDREGLTADEQKLVDNVRERFQNEAPEKPKTTEHQPFMTDEEIEAARRRLERTRRITTARETETTERGLTEEREKLLIGEVLDRGEIILHMGWPSKYASVGREGFSDISGDRLKIDSREIHNQAGELRSIQEQEECNEIVRISPMTRAKYEQETWKEPTGLLRSKKRTRSIVVGREPVSHQEMVEGGSSEPATLVSYEACALRGQEGWKVPDGRSGQMIRLDVVLPKSTADKLSTALESDPSLMHRLVEQAAIQKAGIPEAAWSDGDSATNGHHLRPPYEQWAAEAGGRSKIRIITESGGSTKQLAA